ncbi:3-carboxymuconate cyclase-like protein [Caballeronia terrestris]|uniref:3-carboxymuconate cyclase-like protein n=1 Tax=Caballeronia terrestris TaxID=1226301 RepID=A0A158IK67_9BURK|nr:beta-propeller fold lactonase family protein [Caballeronia terrestris]SAL56887.1 3-carboxymuconate cyclase-like protein [Caballeronia terrestris]
MNQPLPDSYSVYVSNSIDGDISVFSLDTQSGELEAVARHVAAESTQPMTLSPDERTLYAATRGARPSIIAYSIDAATGDLSHRVTAPIESSLAYLSADPLSRYLFGASYGENRASVYDVERIADGIGKPLFVVDGIQNAHAAIVSSDGRFAYVTSLGSDRLFCYELKQDQHGELAHLDALEFDRGFGPRHLRFSRDESTLYVVSEFRATVAVFERDRETGRLSAAGVSPRPAALAHLKDGQVRGGTPIDPETLATLVWGADMQLTPDGRFVYVSERTTSRLITYRVQPDGTLEYQTFIETETQPRGFRIDPAGRFLVACGEKSSHVAVYGIDAESGALSLLSRCEGGNGANWVEIVARVAPSLLTV